MAGLNIVEKVIALEGVELLKNLTPEQLSRIASIAREVKHPPNKVVFDPSAPMDALLVVVDGSVELSREGAARRGSHAGDRQDGGRYAPAAHRPRRVLRPAVR